MKEKKEETLIEVGSYKLYRGVYHDMTVTAIIKCGFITYLVEADTPIDPSETREFVASMLNDGVLCDSYMKKTTALKDLHRLMAHSMT